MPVNQAHNNDNLYRVSILCLAVALLVLIPTVFTGFYARSETVALIVNTIFFISITFWLICILILFLRTFSRANGAALLLLILVPFAAIMALALLFISIIGS